MITPSICSFVINSTSEMVIFVVVDLILPNSLSVLALSLLLQLSFCNLHFLFFSPLFLLYLCVRLHFFDYFVLLSPAFNLLYFVKYCYIISSTFYESEVNYIGMVFLGSCCNFTNIFCYFSMVS